MQPVPIQPSGPDVVSQGSAVRHRVLVVEDEKVLAALLEDFLGWNRFEVKVVDSLHSALEIEDEFKPECILLDIILPEDEGAEAFEHFKSLNAKVFIMSVLSKDTIHRLYGISGFRHLAKPFDFNVMLEMIRKDLEGKR